MQTEWHGHYLDGRTALSQRATIYLTESGLRISLESGRSLSWPYGEIRQTQGFYSGEQIRLERGGEIAEALLVSEEDFLISLHQFAPKLAKHLHDPRWRGKRAPLILAAAAATVGIVAALYFWGIPALAAIAAARVPVSWEERLGEAVISHLAPEPARCADPGRSRMIETIMTTLTTPLGRSPYRFRVIIVDQPTVNALAAPGGPIVIFRGLLEQTRSAEELAGVLAHEIQHILKRHSTRALFEHASTGLLMAAVAGDVSGIAAFGLETARTLGLLRYSRRSEEEADAEGMRLLLAAGVDPAGMIAFFETMEKKDGAAPALLAYLSTHPGAEQRVEKLRTIAQGARQKPIRLVPNYDWREIKKICPAAPKKG
ncbi:MAG: M48 family metallopeptidase [Deltaproteobacteria bacterium]|nr:M48 family metallopeptidase [Deltaproteobacteria bacterium]